MFEELQSRVAGGACRREEAGELELCGEQLPDHGERGVRARISTFVLKGGGSQHRVLSRGWLNLTLVYVSHVLTDDLTLLSVAHGSMHTGVPHPSGCVPHGRP